MEINISFRCHLIVICMWMLKGEKLEYFQQMLVHLSLINFRLRNGLNNIVFILYFFFKFDTGKEMCVLKKIAHLLFQNI